MLFRDNIEPRCAYCAKSRPLDDNDVICSKHGVVSLAYSCRSFKYDPLKRVPPRTGELQSKDLDLSIDPK